MAKGNRLLILIQLLLALMGILLVVVAVEADWLGVGGEDGWGPDEVVSALTGVGLLVVGYSLRRKSGAVWLPRFGKALTVLFVWLVLLTFGLMAGELYSRHVQGYLLWTLPLEKSSFCEYDRLKTYNRRFCMERRLFFREWPIRLELFDTKTPRPRYLFKPNLRFVKRGNRLCAAKPGESVYWSSNSWGFRGTEFSVNKPPGIVRIVCLGASTTEGSQGDKETYPCYLQRSLSRSLPNRSFEVINAGHHGQDIDDLLEILRQRVLPLQPDMIIFYEASNNISFTEFTNKLPCAIGFPEGTCWLTNHPEWYRQLRARSAMFASLSDRLGRSSRPPVPMPHEFDTTSPKPSAIHYEEVLRQIVRESLGQGSQVVLSSFITVAREGLKVSPQENPQLFDDVYRKYYPLTPDEIASIYQYFNRRSAEVAREFHIPYADVAATFPRNPRYFPFDYMHLSPEGNRLLAQLFATFLEERVLPEFWRKHPGAQLQPLVVMHRGSQEAVEPLTHYSNTR